MTKRHIRARVSVQIPLSLYGAPNFFELMFVREALLTRMQKSGYVCRNVSRKKHYYLLMASARAELALNLATFLAAIAIFSPV